MKAIILFESYFGNTQQIAEAIGKSLSKKHDVQVFNIAEVSLKDVQDADLIIVGSATRAFSPCEATKLFLKNIPANGLKGINVVSFDTRILLTVIHSKISRCLIDSGGYAAKRISKKLEKKGGNSIFPPEGFFVLGDKGPLAEGELERARKWAEQIVK